MSDPTQYPCAMIPGKTLLVEPCDNYAVSLEIRDFGYPLYGGDIILSDEDAERLGRDILARVEVARTPHVVVLPNPDGDGPDLHLWLDAEGRVWGRGPDGDGLHRRYGPCDNLAVRKGYPARPEYLRAIAELHEVNKRARP